MSPQRLGLGVIVEKSKGRGSIVHDPDFASFSAIGKRFFRLLKIGISEGAKGILNAP